MFLCVNKELHSKPKRERTSTVISAHPAAPIGEQ
jgi:hypothetical protein